MDIVIYNPSSSVVALEKGKIVGSVSDVHAAFSLPGFPESEKNIVEQNCRAEVNQISTEELMFDLECLTLEQKQQAEKMLDGKNIFSLSKDDIATWGILRILS